MEVTHILTVFVVALAVAMAGIAPTLPPGLPLFNAECDCAETINTTCEDGRGICYNHPDSAAITYLICRATCGEPPVIDNAGIIGGVSFEQTLEGTTLTYECTGGATEIEAGVVDITCPYSGVWTSSSFACNYACTVPVAPAESTLPNAASGYAGGDTVTFECNAGYGSEECVTATCDGDTGKWNYSDGACVEVCEEDWFAFEGSCYFFGVGLKKTWFEAEAYCNDRAAILAHADNQPEADWIAGKLIAYDVPKENFWSGLNDNEVDGITCGGTPTSPPLKLGVGQRAPPQPLLQCTPTEDGFSSMVENFWSGLNDIEVEGEYIWRDTNLTTTFFNWGPNEPRPQCTRAEDCVSFFKRDGYQWNDNKCSKPFGPVCEKGLATE